MSVGIGNECRRCVRSRPSKWNSQTNEMRQRPRRDGRNGVLLIYVYVLLTREMLNTNLFRQSINHVCAFVRDVYLEQYTIQNKNIEWMLSARFGICSKFLLFSTSFLRWCKIAKCREVFHEQVWFILYSLCAPFRRKHWATSNQKLCKSMDLQCVCVCALPFTHRKTYWKSSCVLRHIHVRDLL